MNALSMTGQVPSAGALVFPKAAPPEPAPALNAYEQLRYAREIITVEGNSLLQLAERLDAEFCRAVSQIYHCRGSVIVTGMGKAGLIGQKIAATLASTGTRSHYLHPAEAVHGDLGRIHAGDVVLALSQSGETEEVTRILPSLQEFGVAIVAITGKRNSTLGRSATVTIELGAVREACSLGLAPSTSTTAMLAIGDALALVASRMRDFKPEDFARFHPAGALGRRLSKVQDCMRPLEECRLAQATCSVREIFSTGQGARRRTGAIMIIDEQGKLCGIFTDSDLARLFEGRRDGTIDGPVAEVMTQNPATVPVGSMMVDAVAKMAERKISELPIIDAQGKPVGLIDITDVVGLVPDDTALAGVASPTVAGVLVSGKETGPPAPKRPLRLGVRKTHKL